MNRRQQELEQRVNALLADPANADSPLGQALQEVWSHLHDHLRRLERLTALSDSYQSFALDRERGVGERLDRQLRRVTRIVRISDKYQTMLREANTRLAHSSNRDPLTDAPNRRALMEHLRHESQRAARGETRFVVAMLDVDFFKGVNDRHGHDAGDRLLVALTQTLGEDLGNGDVCGRWGGEEFLIVLSDTDLTSARAVLERKTAAARALRIPTDTGDTGATLSVGLAEHQPGEPVATTLDRADAALYQAKRQGRDRIVP